MRRHLPLLVTGLAASLGLMFLVWQLWLTFVPTAPTPRNRPDPPRNTAANNPDPAKPPLKGPKAAANPNPTTARSANRPAPVEVTLAGVTSYTAPLHANAVGRPPVKEGPRTLTGPTIPPDPVAYAASLPTPDPDLVAYLRRWRSSIATGSTPPDAAALDPLLERTTLAAHQLYDIGRAIRFVEATPDAGLPFYRAAIRRATQAAGDGSLTPADTTALAFLARPLWENREYRICTDAYDILRRTEPEGSFAAYRAAHLYAEGFYMLGWEQPSLSLTAADIYVRMLNGETNGYTPGPDEVADLHWGTGLALRVGGKVEESIPYFRTAAEYPKNQYFSDGARMYLITTLAEAGHVAEAQQALETYQESLKPDSLSRATQAIAAATPPSTTIEPSTP